MSFFSSKVKQIKVDVLFLFFSRCPFSPLSGCPFSPFSLQAVIRVLGNNDNPKMLMGAAFKECKDSPQRSRVHKAPRPQADIYQPWETVGVGARLRATRQMLPADRTRTLRLSRERGAAFKKCQGCPFSPLKKSKLKWMSFFSFSFSLFL
jgi:hypothetical protein